MFKKIIVAVFIFILGFVKAQQNEDFKKIKDYYDYQRFLLNTSFKKKFDQTDDALAKMNIKKDFAEFMVKMDSVQNTALIGALIKVRNTEDLEQISLRKNPAPKINPKSAIEKSAEYPGGIETLRSQVTKEFYFAAANVTEKTVRTNIKFIVDKDGSIRYVRAEGDNAAFNRQAEIAMYLLPDKFSPALVDGQPVRYQFSMPLVMNFE